MYLVKFFFFQAEDGIRDGHVTGVQTCALPICRGRPGRPGDLEEDLLAVDLDGPGRADAEPHLVPADLEHGDDDVVPDHDALVGAAGEDEHRALLSDRTIVQSDRIAWILGSGPGRRTVHSP